MKYAVKVDGMYQELAFDPQLARMGINGSKTTTTDHAIAEAVAKARGGKVVRVLSHEEAKRKYAAKLLMNIAVEQHGEADSGIWSRDGSEGVRAVANTLESIAEEQWPALFHAGDGKTPRGK